MEQLQGTGQVGEAVSLPDSTIRIPVSSLWFVQATCNWNQALSTVLLEPLSYGVGNLPTNLLISSALSVSTILGLDELKWPDLSRRKQEFQSRCCVSTVTHSVSLMEMWAAPV